MIVYPTKDCSVGLESKHYPINHFFGYLAALRIALGKLCTDIPNCPALPSEWLTREETNLLHDLYGRLSELTALQDKADQAATILKMPFYIIDKGEDPLALDGRYIRLGGDEFILGLSNKTPYRSYIHNWDTLVAGKVIPCRQVKNDLASQVYCYVQKQISMIVYPNNEYEDIGCERLCLSHFFARIEMMRTAISILYSEIMEEPSLPSSLLSPSEKRLEKVAVEQLDVLALLKKRVTDAVNMIDKTFHVLVEHSKPLTLSIQHIEIEESRFLILASNKVQYFNTGYENWNDLTSGRVIACEVGGTFPSKTVRCYITNEN